METWPGQSRHDPTNLGPFSEWGPEVGKDGLCLAWVLVIELALCRETTCVADYVLHVENVLCRQHYRTGTTFQARRTRFSRPLYC